MNTMTLQEMQSAVCLKLPDLIEYKSSFKAHFWKNQKPVGGQMINWPTEGLQICHEAEKLLIEEQVTTYGLALNRVSCPQKCGYNGKLCAFTYMATYEQRLEALCRVLFPENFQ